MEYTVVHGGTALVTRWVLRTKHVPGAVAVLAGGAVVWGPLRAKEPYLVCQDGERQLWKIPMPGAVRQIEAVGSVIYAIVAHHGDDTAVLVAVALGGQVLNRYALRGFAVQLAVDPERSRILISSCDRSLAHPAELAVFEDGTLVGRSMLTVGYHWIEVVSIAGEQWLANLKDRAAVLDRDGSLVGEVALPGAERIAAAPVEWRVPNLSGQTPAHRSAAEAVLGLIPPFSAEDAKNAYRQALRRWHPDVNDSPEAGAKTREVIEAYQRVADSLSTKNTTCDGEKTTYLTPDFIRRLAADADTHEAILSCRSGVVYRYGIEGLVRHCRAPDSAEVLCSRAGGAVLLVRQGAELRVAPGDTLVAQDSAIELAFAVQARSSAGCGFVVAFSGDSPDIFIGRNSLEAFHHLRFPMPVRAVATALGSRYCAIAAGNIYLAEFDPGVAGGTELGGAPLVPTAAGR